MLYYIIGVSNLFLKFVSWVLHLTVWSEKVEEQKSNCVPPIKNELLKISATDLAEKIRKKEVSCVEVTQAYITRIKEVNVFLNAVVEERFNNALKEAKAIDNYLNTTSLTEDELKKIKPLLGVPLTVKESCQLSGMSFAVGSLMRQGVKASTDGEVVSRLKQYGVIPLLVSNTPELCLSWETFNLLTGFTNNPYDFSRTPGASSGGEGALIGSGASLLGIGSDIAGSVRLPSLFCGIFGHKPTPRLISIKGHYPLPNDEKCPEYLVIGPMARYAKDLKLMTTLMAGKRAFEVGFYDKVNVNELNIFFMEEAGDSCFLPNVEVEIKQAVIKCVDYLQKNHNCKIMEHKFKNLDQAHIFSGSVLYQMKDIPNYLKGENATLLGEICRSLNGSSKLSINMLYSTLIQNIYRYFYREKDNAMNENLKQEFIEKLGSNGVFIYPTFPNGACKHREIMLQMIGVGSYLSIINTLGLPSTHVPCGKNERGLPIGVQIVAAPFQDKLCLAVAEELEKCFGGWIPPS